MSLTHFLIYRQYPFEQLNSIRTQREAQEMLAVKELSVLNSQFPAQTRTSPAAIWGARRRACPLVHRRAELLLAAHGLFHYNHSERQEVRQLCLTRYVALIKPLPRALNATAYSAEWNLKGFLVQLDCFSDVQPNYKYLLSIQNRLETACTQSTSIRLLPSVADGNITVISLWCCVWVSNFSRNQF